MSAKKTIDLAGVSLEDFEGEAFYPETLTAKGEAKDPYYDYSVEITIPPEDVSGRTQKMHVIFKDQSFREKYHVQWVEEAKYSEYAARGFQPVRREWVASSWTHALSQSNNNESDKIRMAVGVGEGGATQYNILLFVTKDIFDRMEKAAHTSFNSRLTAKDSELERVQQSVLDTAKIRKANGY